VSEMTAKTFAVGDTTDGPVASVIIAVYNKPDFLEKILVSLLNQTFQHFEVIIADDGSGPDIKEVVEKYSGRFSFPLRHVWHDDSGFRKTVIANKAVAASRAEYLIFIDGDSILHHRFVESHCRFKKRHTVLSGRRIMLDRELSERMTLDDVRSRKIEKPSFWWRHCQRVHIKHGFFVPVMFFIENFLRRKYSILGCNFSLFKSDYEDINGYDERIIGRGMEDSNIDARLRLKKIRIKTLTRQALQYHLFHRFDPVPHDPETIRHFCFPEESWTEYGLIKGVKK
jgi:glycosyltransferase involved in cell wall biosynthesis